jgi:hypothetical protein
MSTTGRSASGRSRTTTRRWSWPTARTPQVSHQDTPTSKATTRRGRARESLQHEPVGLDTVGRLAIGLAHAADERSSREPKQL